MPAQFQNIPHDSARGDCAIAQKMRHRRKSNKADPHYWRNRLFKPRGSSNWHVEIRYRGERHKLSLETANKEVGAQKACDIYLALLAKRPWTSVLAELRPKSAKRRLDPTLGQFIEAVRATADIKATTLESYIRSIRKIASDLLELPLDGARYDYRGGGRAQWLEQVDAVRLSWLSASRIQMWKKSFLIRAGSDPLSQRRARTSTNSFLRNCRNLFSKKILRHLELEVPIPLPFSEVAFEARASVKYYQSFDLGALIQMATQELQETDPEAFKVFLLASMAGLRRKEIDLLEWSALRWEENVIRIEHTRYFTPKSLDSAGEVSIDPELIAIFRGYRERDPGALFVIESVLPPKPRVTYNYYRCEAIFRRLSAWLQEHGIKSPAPIHELRKAFGSAICERAGIHQASRSLRHSDIRVTSQVYVDSKSRVSVGLGHLLAPLST